MFGLGKDDMARKNDRFDVKMLLNRLLYSFYCFERWQFRVSVWLFLPIIRRFGKIIYDWNPWGEIDDNTTLEMFLERKLKESDYMWNNLDCGRGITIAFCWLSGIFLPYMLLFATLLFPVSSIMFDIILVLLALPLWTTIYWFTDRDHIYEVYFRKFMRRKSNLKWHVITSLLTIGALVTMLLCVYLCFFKQMHEFRLHPSPFGLKCR